MADTTETGALTPRSGKSIVNRGILEEHAKKVGRYNRLKNWLMVFRPINPDVAKKLGEGYRGKVIFIKSKSSEFPPIGGDIPFEAELSKSFDKGKDTIDHFNQIAKQAVENIRGDTEEKQNENKKYKEGLEKKIRETKGHLETNKQELETKKQELETKKQELETKKQELETAKDSLEKLKTKKQELETAKDSLEKSLKQLKAEEQELENNKQELEAEIKKDEKVLKNAIDEYNINFFLGKTTKKILIENEQFELSYKKVDPAVNGHNIETEQLFEKDENGNDISVLRPVFYAIKDGKYYKIKEYNDDGSIKGLEKDGLSGDDNVFPKVEIFTYSQFKINENGEISEDNPPLTADYDQLSAGPVYMTINDRLDENSNEKKLWETIDYITGLQNCEFNQENAEQIKNHLKNIQTFLPAIKQGEKDKYSCIRNYDNINQINANKVKEQIEYLKDSLLIPIGNEDLNTIDYEFCTAERDKLITYPADKYMEELRGAINSILDDDARIIGAFDEKTKSEFIEDINKDNNQEIDKDINKDDSEKIQKFKKKYSSLSSLNNEGSIRAFLNEIDKLPGIKFKGALTEKVENLNNTQFRKNWNTIKDNLQKIEEFLPDEFKQKYLYFQEETLDPNLIDIDEIKTQVYIVSKKLGLLGTCSEAITKEKMAIGERLDYGISHGLEIQHFPPESIKRRGEEFLIVDEMGKIRVVDGLEGFLSNVNYKKSRGIACLEVNPLWQIEKDENGDIVYSEEPNPIASIYSSLAGLQAITSKGLPEEEQKDFDPLGQYMYAERLYYNGDFVPYAQGIRRQNPAKFESLKTEVEIDSLTKAEEAYEKSIKQLEQLMESEYLEYDFLEFCGKAPITGLASYLENHEEITDLFKNPEIKKKFTEEEFITELIDALEDKEHILENEEQQKQFVRGNFGQNISEDQIEKLTNALFNKEENNKFRKLFIEDNPSGQNTAKNTSKIKNMQKLFGVLPNLNLSKGLEKGIELKNEIENSIEFLFKKQEKIEKKLLDKIPLINKTESITSPYEDIKKNLCIFEGFFWGKMNWLIEYRDQISSNENTNEEISKKIDNINKKIKFLFNEEEKFWKSKMLVDIEELRKRTSIEGKVPANIEKSLKSTSNDVNTPKKFASRPPFYTGSLTPPSRINPDINKPISGREISIKNDKELLEMMESRFQKISKIEEKSPLGSLRDKTSPLTKIKVADVSTGSPKGREPTSPPMTQQTNKNYREVFNQNRKLENSILGNAKWKNPPIIKPVVRQTF